MSGRLRIILLIAVLFATRGLSAQYESDLGRIVDQLTVFDDFFVEEKPILLTLKFNIKEYQKTRSKEEYQSVELVYNLDDTTQITHNVKLKTRGEFRKKYCSLPPFWLNIKKAGITSNELEDVTRMKIVTQCKKSDVFGDYLLKEYLVYKMYSIISPYSFRVRLIKMTYIDTGRDNKVTENWAFAIEPEELMEKRLNSRFINNDKLAMATVNNNIMDRLAMFQYMIGNADYSITGRHNIKIMVLNDSGPMGYIPVPYDYDYTGFVNTTYAVPGENLGIHSVRERYFLGPCRSYEIYTLVTNDLEMAKSDILFLLQQFEYLSLNQKIEALKYIESYYTESASSRFIPRNIKITCR